MNTYKYYHYSIVIYFLKPKFRLFNSEGKKEKKRKKKKKSDSADEEDFGGGGGVAEEEGSGVAEEASRKSRKSRAQKAAASTPATPQSQADNSGMPTVEEVCSTFGLTDVTLDFSDEDYQNLTTYKLFQQHVRPILSKDNPKVFIYSQSFRISKPQNTYRMETRPESCCQKPQS
ncbi:chromodomain-helicase-DNA-binding protein Mi-2 homolog [Nilaparvata lugens]|uniref:chromodomain-helicase-DNA-binding protein Mi-2 homolog n=1 Tax=Nilaparvata lugens TaxID=108931 RepID=UPI00193E2631|nr:chromodomain-helicase-DNA-binding protein Mi-2 homolog [Nilaparvata lugens]